MINDIDHMIRSHDYSVIQVEMQDESNVTNNMPKLFPDNEWGKLTSQTSRY